ncbi:AAA family ATPase [uncultured Clostridium sp.]|uniref:AAA family ATPase n=1 Tax=uncultured Clostridium sp. TaxID=59620 RepID=UPI0025D6D6AC|nr:AAA family ATPase [uncultured Clostridium sp.]
MISIKSIEIKNFRVYKNEKIDFQNNQLILLTGSNGYGKTSLIDAIEWCITGDIKRAHLNYDDRNSSNSEKKRNENQKGILKNKYCEKNDKVRVTLILSCDGEEVSITRERKEDSLNTIDDFKINGNNLSDAVLKSIEDLKKEDSIYKYHCCDMNKAYRFMNSSRQDLKTQVSDFLRDRSSIDTLLKNLKTQLDNLNDKLDTNSRNITINKEKKDKLDEQKEKTVISNDIKTYPQEKAYNNEPSKIESLEQAKSVQRLIRGWGYKYAYNNIIRLKKSEDAIIKKKNLDDIKLEYEKNSSLIDKFIAQGLNNEENRNSILYKIKELQSIKNILKKKFNADDIEYNLNTEIRQRFIEAKKKYNIITEEISLIDKTIDTFGKGSNLIQVFTMLIDNKNELLEKYRDLGNKKCPLCGSIDRFSTISSNDIAREAQVYLDNQDKIKTDTILVKKNKEENIDSLWKEFDEFTSNWIENKLTALNEKNIKQNREWIQIKSFFELLEKEHIECNKDTKILHIINEKITENNKQILSSNDSNLIFEDLYKVLEYLEYDNLEYVKLKRYANLSNTIKVLFDNDIDYKSFNFPIMIKKVTYLSSYIASDSIKDIDKQLLIINKKINDLESLKNKFTTEQKQVDSYIKKIEKSLKEVEKCEFEAVGPYLYEIFSKLIKHTNINGFKFHRDDVKNQSSSGSAFLDDDDNNILNMFSEGQLGVFIISYFIANLLRRKDESKFDTFFIDDITSCLDDINILSFIDIIKYLLKDTRNNMNQLFFATCNDNIESLFKNRMEGFKIPYKIIKFTAVGITDKSSNVN